MRMIYDEPVYDLGELARKNLHVHTRYSSCAKPEMVVSSIINAAEAAGLETIALTDHYNFAGFDGGYMEQIAALKREFEATGSKIQVLFSSELSCYGPGKCLEREDTAEKLDYRLYTCNHYHLDFWEHPEDKTARGYALFSLKTVEALMRTGRADCIAHPFIGRFVRALEDRTEVTRAITDNELGELCELARDTSTALELNTGAITGDPAFFRRLWDIGREAGATFHYGTDAHVLASIDTRQFLPRLKEILCREA